MAQTTNDSRLIAKELLVRGVHTYPVRPGEKAPKGRNWQQKRLDADSIDEEFGPTSNILRLNGEPSGWQVDVDCDTPEAAAAAKLILPYTSWLHGHAANPESHHTFICEGARSARYSHPNAKATAGGRPTKEMIVEIRSTGSGTIMPGSVHTSKNLCVYYNNGQALGTEPPAVEPTRIEQAELTRLVGRVAAVGLLAPEWGEGGRHNMALHLSGMLLHGGMVPEDMEDFIRVLCTVGQDEDVEGRVQTAKATAETFAAGDKVTGFPNLAEFLDTVILKKVSEWLGLKSNRPTQSGLGADGKPCVTLNGDFSAELEATVTYLLEANAPEPKYFNFSGRLAVIEETRKAGMKTPLYTIKALDVDTAREVVADQMQFMGESDEDKDTKFKRPTRDLLSTLVKSSRIQRFPAVGRLTHGPVMAYDGSLHTRAGYDTATEAYLCVTGLDALEDTSEVSEEDVRRAVALFNDGPLSGFAFDSEASRTHVFCGLLQPIVRTLITGDTPLHLVEAPTRGSGKTLLARFIGGVNTPHIEDTFLPLDEKEREKLILSLLMTTPEAILLDNIAGFVNSPSLDKALTSQVYTGRVLGSTGTISLPNTALWMATGNNVSFGGDLASRTLRIGLDTGMEKPEQKTDYLIPDLDAWTRENRVECLKALLTLIRFWKQRDSPSYTGDKYHRMIPWMQVMGGICEAVGLPGFLDNAEMLEEVDGEAQKWCRFVEAWHQAHGGKSVKAKELVVTAFGESGKIERYEAIADNLMWEPGPLFTDETDKMSPTGRVKRLTDMIKKRRNVVFGEHRITVNKGADTLIFSLIPAKPRRQAV